MSRSQFVATGDIKWPPKRCDGVMLRGTRRDIIPGRLMRRLIAKSLGEHMATTLDLGDEAQVRRLYSYPNNFNEVGFLVSVRRSRIDVGPGGVVDLDQSSVANVQRCWRRPKTEPLLRVVPT